MKYAYIASHLFVLKTTIESLHVITSCHSTASPRFQMSRIKYICLNLRLVQKKDNCLCCFDYMQPLIPHLSHKTSRLEAFYKIPKCSITKDLIDHFTWTLLIVLHKKMY